MNGMDEQQRKINEQMAGPPAPEKTSSGSVVSMEKRKR
jgi:hypothetical protein